MGQREPTSLLNGIVLAGVHPWRDSALERSTPRTLLPIANRPLIEHVMAWLRGGGVTSTGICANSHTKALYRTLKDGRAQHMAIYYYEDLMPRGPAGCIKDAMLDRPLCTVVVTEGTILPQAVDLERMLDTHAESNAAMTIAVAADGNGRQGNGVSLAPVGIYILASRILDHVSARGYQDIKEGLIPKLYSADENVAAYLVEEPVPRVKDDAGSYLAADAWVLERMVRSGQTPEGYRCDGEALIHETASVDENALLIGPVLVGPDSSIAGRATVIGPTTIGPRCTLGEGALVSRSLLWPGAKLGRGCIVDSCIVTHDIELRAATTHGNRVCSSC